MTIDITNTQKIKVNVPKLKKLARFVLQQEGIKDGYLSVALVKDKKIGEINRRYRRVNQTTDVLAFDLSGSPALFQGGSAKGEKEWGLIGDIILSVETAERKARELKHSLEEELFLYLTHGILHLAGYDDTDEESYLQMKKRQEELMEKFKGTDYTDF
ncbi:MAG: rRNA maturation RNase YbeY [Candidatus Omnitrophica bacterium 4484_213]|nr:MAG: rRNA maturation RNase YbeY [Candidatus Omnitrophica bacterium 4484_213]